MRLGPFPPVTVMPGDKMDTHACAMAPCDFAEVHGGIANDPQPKGLRQGPIVIDLQPCARWRDLAHDARRKRPVERLYNSCLHTRWQAGKVMSFLEKELTWHGFARLRGPRPY